MTPNAIWLDGRDVQEIKHLPNETMVIASYRPEPEHCSKCGVAVRSPLVFGQANAYIKGMGAVSIIFAVVMIALAIASALWVGWLTGSLWAAIGFAAVLVVTFRLFADDRSAIRRQRRDELNAFQQPLADE